MPHFQLLAQPPLTITVCSIHRSPLRRIQLTIYNPAQIETVCRPIVFLQFASKPQPTPHVLTSRDLINYPTSCFFRAMVRHPPGER
jgi:hypothetical protein